MNRAKWVALIAGVLALLLGGRMVLRYLDWQASDAARSKPGAPRLTAVAAGFSEVERASLDACLCRRKGGSDAACDVIYTGTRDQMLKRVFGNSPPPADVADVSSAPVSNEVECFAFADGQRCLTTRFYVVVSSENSALDEVCTAEEERAIEQASESAWCGPDGKEPASNDQAAIEAANRRSITAIDEVLRRIKSNEQLRAPPPKSDCAA